MQVGMTYTECTHVDILEFSPFPSIRQYELERDTHTHYRVARTVKKHCTENRMVKMKHPVYWPKFDICNKL